jgi:hypothetical protein
VPSSKKKAHDDVIGTAGGYVWHLNRKEPSCEPCLTAANAYRTDWRLRGKCAPGLGWPLTLRRRKPPRLPPAQQ